MSSTLAAQSALGAWVVCTLPAARPTSRPGAVRWQVQCKGWDGKAPRDSDRKRGGKRKGKGKVKVSPGSSFSGWSDDDEQPQPARPFVFVREGEAWDPEVGSAILVDGLVQASGHEKGKTEKLLHLSHWNGNVTPEAWYADTSTGIVLRFLADVEAGLTKMAVKWGKRRPREGAPSSTEEGGGKKGEKTRKEKKDKKSKGDKSPGVKLVGKVTTKSSEVATVVNNHYDTDGLLSVWAMQYPEAALEHAEILVYASEASDFNEWPLKNRGLKLSLALDAIRADLLELRRREEEIGNPPTLARDEWLYARILPLVGDLVVSLDKDGGTEYEGLWGPEYVHLCEEYVALKGGAVESQVIELGPDGDVFDVEDHPRSEAIRVGLVVHPPNFPDVSGYSIHRRFFGKGWGGKDGRAGVDRYLLVRTLEDEDAEAVSYEYTYTRPGHAWAPTVTRPQVPLPKRLGEFCPALKALTGVDWEEAKTVPMVGLVQTTAPTEVDIDEVLRLLLSLEGPSR